MANVKGNHILTLLYYFSFYVFLSNSSVLDEVHTGDFVVNGIKEITNISSIIKLDNVMNNIGPLLNPEAQADLSLNITQLIEKYGYSVEVHNVTTKDGYILNMYRIPGSGPTVFLMHGIIEGADIWVTTGGDRGVAFLLAAQGYDVWLGNQRGNRYSLNHIQLDSLQPEFWNFSFHEIGLYDLPASIDYVLEETNTSSLIYVGHSQGSTTFYVMCSLMPEYNKKISLMVALAPIAWVSHLKSVTFRPILQFLNDGGDALLNALGIYEVFAHDTHLPLERALCGNTVTAYFICQLVISTLGGFNYAQVNIPRLPVIFSHFPTGAALKQFVHYAQLMDSGYFRQYDYKTLNMEKYNQLSPPSYPVENITAPIALFFGENDLLSVKEDVDILVPKLANVTEFYTLPDKKFQHFDFLWSKDINSTMLPKLIELIEKYKPQP